MEIIQWYPDVKSVIQVFDGVDWVDALELQINTKIRILTKIGFFTCNNSNEFYIVGRPYKKIKHFSLMPALDYDLLDVTFTSLYNEGFTKRLSPRRLYLSDIGGKFQWVL